MVENFHKQKGCLSFPLRQIYFYITGGCNLACHHCWIAPKYLAIQENCPSLDFDLFRSIVKQAKLLGLTGVKLTGGEPTLHPQIMNILRFIRFENLRITIETNGILCTPELSRELAAGKNPFVSVSLDGVDKETHEWVRGREGCFQKALEGIRNLVGAGLKPQIIMTLMRRNKDQIEEVIRLAKSLGAGSVKFNILQPTARGKKMHEEGEALNIEELVSLGQRVENRLSATTSLWLFYHHPLAFRPFGRVFGHDGNGCNTCGVLRILGVLSDGSYALCGIGQAVPELIFGHAERDHLSDVWNDAPTLMELRNGIPHRFEGICRDCLLKGICLGSCLAQNYYTHKNLWSGFWYCERANQNGLFPESRRRERKEEIQ